jgi:hypothetical protein
MTMIAIPTQPAPLTPLNLKFDVVYAPREATPPLVGYMVIADCSTDDGYAIVGYEASGDGCTLFRGSLGDTYVRMAGYLRMGA